MAKYTTIFLLVLLFVSCTDQKKNKLTESKRPEISGHDKFITGLDDETIPTIDQSGDVLEVDLGENRIAKVMFANKPTTKILIRFDITENTCIKTKPIKCFMGVHVFSTSRKMVWSKHPDSTKVGETVQAAFPEYDDNGDLDESQLSFEDLITPESHAMPANFFNPKLKRGFRDYISCDDWSWLPNVQKLEIQAWSGEFMTPNTETGVNENKSAFGAYNMSLDKFDEKNRQLSNPEYYQGMFGAFSFPFSFGDAGAFYYKDGSESCMVGYKSDSATLIQKYRDYDANTPANYKDYHKGQDTTMSYSNDISEVIDDVSSRVYR